MIDSESMRTISKFFSNHVVYKIYAVYSIFCTVHFLSTVSICNGSTNGSINRSIDNFINLEGKIDIAGGTAHLPVMKEAANNIMKRNSKIRISVTGGGSGIGVQKVAAGLVEIGNTGRALSQMEINRYGLKTFPFAIDGVAIIVHPRNPVGVRALNSDQIRDIYQGKITDWNQLTKPITRARANTRSTSTSTINVYTRDEASGTLEVFINTLLYNKNEDNIKNSAVVLPSNGAMKIAVSNDPNAIGFVSMGTTMADSSITTVSLDGVAATQENVRKGIYKLARKLYMNTKGQPSKLVQKFIEYIYSDEGKQIISRAGYLPFYHEYHP
ncbi:MAG: phosphate ABC transporter substrate-binding protein [Oligoflexia bacterium]|nr:phosphate ABC transporter substrate-binding protein [Oligoflexia bacterium]